MATPDDVQVELKNDGDWILVYEGHPNPSVVRRTGSLRYWLKCLVWDLLRFFPIDYGKPNPDRKVPYGLRDSVARIMFQTDQNNQLLRRLAKAANVDISDLP